MDFESSLLFCCEEMSSSSPCFVDNAPSASISSNQSGLLAPAACCTMPGHVPDEEDELTIAVLISKQAEYMPGEVYSTDLRNNRFLRESRLCAARWMIKAHALHKFSPLTVAMAVNYLDRYLQKSFFLPWKAWMIELLTIACLSVAAKMEEVDVPALLDLQIEGMEHLFQAKTVQRMELNVLGALGWRLRCITPFSFVEKAINHFDINRKSESLLMSRVSEFVLETLLETEFLDFDPSVLAVTSIHCALEEILPLQADLLKLSLLKYIPLDEDIIRRCYILMETLIVDPLNPSSSLSERSTSPVSPNAVICHHETRSSVDIGEPKFLLTLKHNVKRLGPLEEECQSNPKRHRRA